MIYPPNQEENTIKEIYACVVGDTGNDTTKIGMNILNVASANDSRNLSLLGLFHGKDSAENLKHYFSELLDNLSNLDGTAFVIQLDEQRTLELKLVLFVTGDMVFLCNLFGVSHAYTANWYCLYCYANKDTDQDRGICMTNFRRRTLEQMQRDYENGKRCQQKFLPLLKVWI